MSVLCIVTARGGSKRVPRKNVRLFMGRPAVSWPVSVAKKSNIFSNILISTDDAEIADIAVRSGAECPFIRPAEIADDKSSTIDVLKFTLNQWAKYSGKLPEYCCCLYGTSIFVTPELILQAKNMVDKESCVMAVSEYEHPIQRAMSIDDSGCLSYNNPEYALTRTQDCKIFYHDIGMLYFFSVSAFFSSGARGFRYMKVLPLIVQRQCAIDIDKEDDFAIAEAIWQIIGRKE